MEKEKLIEKIEDRLPELIEKAIDMRNYSYAPYSKFRVGAALLAKDGKIFGGCNIENAAYGPSNCAERTAFFKAVSEGVQDFSAIVIAGGPEEGIRDFCAPCGVCRQVMAEFCEADSCLVILAKSVEEYEVYTLRELFPKSFSPKDLEKV
ncbi:MAG: cytidine deaminase [Lachnospiraceae bacterium]|nr:cytidine deaminase [Lachnospiraceae bacterium]